MRLHEGALRPGLGFTSILSIWEILVKKQAGVFARHGGKFIMPKRPGAEDSGRAMIVAPPVRV